MSVSDTAGGEVYPDPPDVTIAPITLAVVVFSFVTTDPNTGEADAPEPPPPKMLILGGSGICNPAKQLLNTPCAPETLISGLKKSRGPTILARPDNPDAGSEAIALAVFARLKMLFMSKEDDGSGPEPILHFCILSAGFSGSSPQLKEIGIPNNPAAVSLIEDAISNPVKSNRIERPPKTALKPEITKLIIEFNNPPIN